MIVRGTTPTIRYTFKKFSVDNIVEAYLTIKQGSVKIEKDITDGEKGDGYIEWTLTQAETLTLDDDAYMKVQCKYKLNDGKVCASRTVTGKPEEILKEDVI